MPSDFPRIRYILPKFDKRDYAVFMKTIDSCLPFDISDVAKFRHHVLMYYYKYGWKPTLEAYGVKKSTLYDWKNRYELSGKNLTSLVPKKTRPKRVRKMETDYRLVEFIKAIREEQGNLGKEKLKLFLDEYAREIGVESIGKTTIGKIIKRRHYFYERPKLKRKRRFTRDRSNKSPKVNKPGYIEMDSIIVYINRERHCFISCIDICTKFAWVKKVTTLSSVQALLTLQEFQEQINYLIHTLQTDNGSEFLGKLHNYLEEQKIKHLFIYPRSPKINGVVERFQRTIQEEFINRNDEIYFDEEKFKTKLFNYLQWYNTKRPHASLSYQSPTQFIQSNFPKCM